MKTKRFLAWFLTFAMLWSLIPSFGISAAAETGDGGSVLLADEPVTVTHSDTKENTNQAGGIVYTKTSTAKSDGTVDITLTAHTTGEVRQMTSVSPTDIVLVLDVSGSMDESYSTTRITGYNEATGGEYTYTTGFWFWEEEHTAYGFEDTDYDYYINTGTAQEPIYTLVTYTGRDSNGFEMYEYSSGNTEVVVYPVLNDVSATREHSYSVVQFYLAATETQTANKMVSLQNAVNSFIDTTAQMNTGLETNRMHTISIVKFADDSYYNSSVATITEGNHKGADGNSNYNYSEVVKGLTPVDEAGAAELKTAVNELEPGGATAVDYGLNLAQAVLMSRSTVVEENAVDRNEVIIVFTDGSPTYSNSFSTSVANNAIAIAGNMESTAGVTVYGVCIDADADATDIDANINKFMHYMTSNFPNATSMTSPGEGGSVENGYYMTPDDSTSLSMIFESIIQEIDHPTITMGEEAAMVDTISPYFDFAGNVEDVKLQTSARNADGTWADPVDDINLSANISGDRLTVDGFDFDANFVSDTGRGDNGDFYGKQLVVSFTVVPDYDVIDAASATLMDGVLPTNSGFASLVDSGSAPAAEVETPELSAHQVTYKVDGEEYTSYNRFTGSDVAVDAVPEKEGYTFSGWTTTDASIDGGSFTMPDNDVEITGTFAPNEYNVTYQYSGTEPTGAPELPTSHTEQYGSTVTVAEPAELQGYVFVGWYPLQTDVTVTEGTFTMPAKDVTLVGYFESSTATPYKVEHYLETLTDGVYEENPKETENFTGTTGHSVSATGLNRFEGFTYNPDVSIATGEIKADGSLVLKLYYDRNEYTVTYGYDGDTQIDGIPALPEGGAYKYGQTVIVANKAVAPDGYNFTGWYRGTADNPAYETFTMPAYNVHLLGYFAADSGTEYTIHHYLETLTDGVYEEEPEETETFTGTTGHTVTATPLNRFTGFEYNETKSAEAISGEIRGDGSLVLKVYYDRKQYKVTYGYDGDVPTDAPELPTEAIYAYGADVTVAAKATAPAGYTFVGWYRGTESNPVSGTFQMPSYDVHILGNFEENANTPYRVEHYLQNAEGTDYDLDGTGETRHGTTGEAVSALAKEYPGFTYNENISNASGTIEGDGSLTLKFYYDRNAHKVTYQYEGMTPEGIPAVPDEINNVRYNVEVTVADAPVVPGYTFSGWATTDANINEGKFNMPDKDVVLKGSFASNLVDYKVNFWLQNITGDDYTLLEDEEGTGYTYKEQAYVGQLVQSRNQTFTGFSLNQDKSKWQDYVTVDENGNGNLVLNLYFDRHTYNVTYGYYGEQPDGAPDLSGKNKTSVRYGTVLNVEAKPTLDGYSFDGWYTRTADVVNNQFTMPDHDVTFLGLFVAEYTVSYDLNGGTGASDVSYADETVSKDTVVSLKAEPTRTDYIFTGWSDGANIYQPNDNYTVTSNVKFTAQWEKDEIGKDNPNEGDDIPDKYQKKIIFKIINGTWDDGTSADIVAVVDLKDENDEYSVDGTANISSIIPTGMVANEGYEEPGEWREVPPASVSGTETESYIFIFHKTPDVIYDEYKEDEPEPTPTTDEYNMNEKILVDPNGGIWNFDGTDYTEIQTITLTDNIDLGIPTRTDYVFMGWKYSDPTPEQEAENIKGIYTAQWEKDEIGKDDPDNGDGVPDKYQKKITFKIVNGKWDDGTATEIVKVVDLKDGTGKYSTTGTADIGGIIPTGMIASEGFKNGAWDTTPPETVSGTEDATYTYTFDRSTTPITPADKVLYIVEHYKVNEDGTYPTEPTDVERLQGTIGENATATPKEYEGYALDESISHMTQTLVKIESPEDIVTLKLYYDIDETGKTDPDDGDGVPDKYQKKIVFKIVNGKWDDGTATEIVKVVDLKNELGNYSANGEADISTIIPTGMSANSGYKNGKWDVEPPETVSGTKDATYTYSYTKSGGGGGSVTTKYTLTYETNGGNKIASEKYNSGATVKLTKVPVKDGFVFEGWYEDKELTKYIEEVKMTKNITVYAKWVEDNGGAGSGYDTPGSLNGEDHFAYVVGYPDGTVRPNDNISRAEVTAIFFRLLKPDEVRDKNLTTENNFNDVNDGDWHNASISTMAKLGIVKGRTADSFVPDAFITRAEFAAICARFDNSEYEVVDNFTDVDGHWAEDEIHEAAAHGWIRGYEDGTFKPDQYITRAEAMTMINRVLNRIPETSDDLLDSMIKWPDNSDESAWYYLAVQEATNSHDYEMKNHIYEKWTALREVTDWTKYE